VQPIAQGKFDATIALNKVAFYGGAWTWE